MGALSGYESCIPGLYVVDLDVREDARGWFKENYQEEKLRALGLATLEIDGNKLQNNISFNREVGTTRGMHAEPWDKYISLASGKVFGAWVDLRAGESFGRVFHTEITPEVAIYVPKGVANGFQTLEPNSAYTYLVNEYWSPELKKEYSFVNLADPELAIPWPIAVSDMILSDDDKNHPPLSKVTPIKI